MNENPTPNMFLLQEVIDTIEAMPERWDQNAWAITKAVDENGACGTACCVAGWAVTLSGYEITYPKVYWGQTDICRKDGDAFIIGIVAQEELGLTDSEARALFYGGNDLDDVKEVAKSIANGDYR